MRFARDTANPNRERFFRAIGVAADAVLGLELAHSRKVLFLSEAADRLGRQDEAASACGVDGILIAKPGLFVSVTVADCMPVWILDRASGAFGVLHSGWKGTGILETATRLLEERFGSRASSISVILGPAIGKCCYAVPEERALAFAAEFGEETAPAVDGERRIDLRAANLSLARRLGIGAVLSLDACTCCDERLGSYRRDGAGSFTRMVAVVGEFPGSGS